MTLEKHMQGAEQAKRLKDQGGKMKTKIYYTILAAGIICMAPTVCMAIPPPPVPEPPTVAAGALLLVPLAVGIVRALRRPRK
jgi:hypothetical protein